MNLPLLIAYRYFFSRKKAHFINIIAILSMFGVGVGTMALIIVLSVFNGLEELLKRMHSTINPELQVLPVKGKSFEVDEDFLNKLNSIEGISVISEIIEDDALLKYKDKQMVIKIKGVADNYLEQSKVYTTLVEGEFVLKKDKIRYAVLGLGVKYTLEVNLNNQLDAFQIWFPKRNKKVNLSSLNPENSFNKKNILPIGVFSLEQQYDEQLVFVPLDFAKALTEYGNQRSYLEIKVKNTSSIWTVQQALKQTLGEDFKVLNSEEQQADLLKAIYIEKLFVYLTLSFILVVASFNIFFSLMMLSIEKQKDVAVLQAMGANRSLIRQVFMLEGILIAFTGAFSGLLMGLLIILLQQQFGFIQMGTQTTVIQAYPVQLKNIDFVFTGITICCITFIASYFPAVRASKMDIKSKL